MGIFKLHHGHIAGGTRLPNYHCHVWDPNYDRQQNGITAIRTRNSHVPLELGSTAVNGNLNASGHVCVESGTWVIALTGLCQSLTSSLTAYCWFH